MSIKNWFIPSRDNRTNNYLYALGMLITLAISVIEVSRGRALNFYIYQEATIDFLNGISPYVGWHERHSLDVFLYLPPFNILFSLFAILPRWLGAILWNVVNFNLLFLSIVLLTKRIGKGNVFLFFYSILIVAQVLFSFQYNLTILYLFILSFILLERGKYWWALTLIVISGATKVYGFFELSLLLLYPQFWKNVTRGTILIIIALLLPALTAGFDGLIQLYQDWYTAIDVHGFRPFETMTRLILISTGLNLYAYGNIILAGVSLLIVIAMFLLRDKFNTFAQRCQLLGIIMVTIILWGTNSERNTYCIAIVGYAIWYLTTDSHNILDRILLVTNFLLICVAPIDILCPKPVVNLLINTLALNIVSMLITWIRMCQYTFFQSLKKPINS